MARWSGSGLQPQNIVVRPKIGTEYLWRHRGEDFLVRVERIVTTETADGTERGVKGTIFHYCARGPHAGLFRGVCVPAYCPDLIPTGELQPYDGPRGQHSPQRRIWRCRDCGHRVAEVTPPGEDAVCTWCRGWDISEGAECVGGGLGHGEHCVCPDCEEAV